MYLNLNEDGLAFGMNHAKCQTALPNALPLAVA
jgi:hypothetical protein